MDTDEAANLATQLASSSPGATSGGGSGGASTTTTPAPNNKPSSPPPPHTTMRKSVVSRATTLLLASNKEIKMMSLRAILARNDTSVDEIRNDTRHFLKSKHASEGIEFICEMQELADITDKKHRHHTLNYIMREFILPDAPREVCFASVKRPPIMDAWNSSQSDVLFNLLHDLAFGEILADLAQNPEFENFLKQMLEEGVVEVDADAGQ
jgi:hypothetical protein